MPRGVGILTLQDDKKGERRRKASNKPDADKKMTDREHANERPPRRRLPSSNVGDALKSAYQRTLDENIPPEMLDLLGKLG